MKNNVLDKIKMQTAKLPVSRFNMANDVAYTTQFGVVTPTHVKYMHAGTKKVVSDERLHYLAPLVVPTFSRLKEKLYHQFVGLSDLLPKSAYSRLVNEPFAAPLRGGNIKDEYFPNISLRLLSSFALLGARCCIWYGDQTTTASTQAGLANPSRDVNVTALYKRLSISTTDGEVYTALNTPANKFYDVGGYTYNEYTPFSRSSNNESASWADASLNAFGAEPPANTLILDPVALFRLNHFSNGKILIPLGQRGLTSLAVDGTKDGSMSPYIGEDTSWYDLEHSDVVYPYYLDYQVSSTWTRRRLYICFHLSDYGKRFKNFLEGCGYKLNFFDDTRVSMLPLLATYKAYYDLFAINLFENFENSDLGYCLNAYDSGAFSTNYDDVTADLISVGTIGATARLVAHFGDLFYTEEVDYISSHTANNAVSPAPNPRMVYCDVDTNGIANVTAVDSSANSPTASPNSNNGHAYINDPVHGQLDAEFLMKAYRWVNRNTIAGQRIAELLRAQGLGDYVDTCKSNFIGYDETPLQINDVISSSDTYNAVSGDGAQLGQRGAKGIGYNDGKKTFEFEANEIGFWITLSVIVPSAGYCQGIDPSLALLRQKDSFYQPDFDALGMQPTQMSAIVDCTKCEDLADVRNSDTFGFTPRMSHFKVARNKILGLFSLASEQDNFLPYMLDKFIPLNKLRQQHVSSMTTSNNADIETARLLNPLRGNQVPTAGVAWRYVGKYLYLESFNRMFSYRGASALLVTASIGYNWSEFVIRDADNFIIHMIDNDQTYAHMKPIEESYETDDDGRTNTSMDKA